MDGNTNLVALSALVEFGQRRLDLGVRDADYAALGSSAALDVSLVCSRTHEIVRVRRILELEEYNGQPMSQTLVRALLIAFLPGRADRRPCSCSRSLPCCQRMMLFAR